MFKIPDWEDVNSINISFKKKIKKKKPNIDIGPHRNNDDKLKKENYYFKGGKVNKKSNCDINIDGRYVMNPNFSKNNSKPKLIFRNDSIKMKNVIKPKEKQHKKKIIPRQLKTKKKCIEEVFKDSELTNLSDSVQNDNTNVIKNKLKKHKHQSINSHNSDSIYDHNNTSDNSIINPSNKMPLKLLKNENTKEVATVKKNNLALKSKPDSRRNKICKKKEQIRKMLSLADISSISKNNSSAGLRQRMLDKLKAAQFRFINEKLYTSSGEDARRLFQDDPEAFRAYHQGYQQQLGKWPLNPLNIIVQKIKNMPKSYLIADMGCGQATLAHQVPQTVRSFDLVSTTPEVEACDMSRTPLLSTSVDVAVYCLALMGTNLAEYLVEANRVLKDGGQLIIAEVESRFENLDEFVQLVQRLGFKVKSVDKSHSVFYFLYFTKVRQAPVKKSKLPNITLKPCFYKKR